MIKVLQDLERLDRLDSLYLICESQNGRLKSKIVLNEMVVSLKDSVINKKDGQIIELNGIIEEREKEADIWRNKYKSQKRQKLGAFGIAILTIILVL